MSLAAGRDESGFVNQQQVQNDVQGLYKAGAGRMGTDEVRWLPFTLSASLSSSRADNTIVYTTQIQLASILVTRSPLHLAAVSQQYHARHGKTLSQAIDSEFSGHMKDALLYIAEAAERDGQGVERDAIMLERAMSGMGTKDERLTWRIIRAHWNQPRWQAVKQAYQRLYGKPLEKRVKGETTGDFEVSPRRRCSGHDDRY